jgi:hypothetical protein
MAELQQFLNEQPSHELCTSKNQHVQRAAIIIGQRRRAVAATAAATLAAATTSRQRRSTLGHPSSTGS